MTARIDDVADIDCNRSVISNDWRIALDDEGI